MGRRKWLSCHQRDKLSGQRSNDEWRKFLSAKEVSHAWFDMQKNEQTDRKKNKQITHVVFNSCRSVARVHGTVRTHKVAGLWEV
jgi:hypothetical protein